MCDTIVAVPCSTANRTTLFGKNSDRQRNEAALIELIPAATHAADAEVACTYISIPQARRTHSILLSRPFWIWGAEMGANEHGVTIGNEGVQARTPPPECPALLGMDLLRLALERASTASEAVQVITTLLERHGQGGNCGHLTPAYYHNSFIVADGREAFVLETVDRDWLVQRVETVRSLSNRYSIEKEPLSVSAGLDRLMSERGWDPGRSVGYSRAIAHPAREHIGNAGARQARSAALLKQRAGQLQAADMMAILRDHGTGEGNVDSAWHGGCTVQRTLCMHAGTAERPGQTVASMVSEIHADTAVHWVTGTAAPCISIFKPVLPGASLPDHGAEPTDRYDAATLWWRHERLHRAALFTNFEVFLADIRAERDALEADFRARAAEVLAGGTTAERSLVVADCWTRASAMEDRWYARLRRELERSPAADEWSRLSDHAGLDLLGE